MNLLIEARGLVKRYGKRTTVQGVDVTVAPGEVVALVGPNGAGKSTTLEMILGLRQPDGGKVTYWTPDPRRQMGVQLQATPFFPGLTVMENLHLFAAFYQVRLAQEDAPRLLERCKLTEAAHIQASRLSGGQQKRLAIAIALVHQPRIVFLDEPTAALDPRARREIRNLIKELQATGTAVVFTSHDMEEVSKLADRIVLICDGKVVLAGAPADLLTKFDVTNLEELYLRVTEGAI